MTDEGSNLDINLGDTLDNLS